MEHTSTVDRPCWRPFRVQYAYNGKLVTDAAYETIQVGFDKEPSRQIIVLPTSGYFLARWNSDAPVDFERLRQRAIANVSRIHECKGSIPVEELNVEPIKISPF